MVRSLDGAKFAMMNLFVVHGCKEEILVTNNMFPDQTSKFLR